MLKLADKSKSAGAGKRCSEASQEVIVTTVVELIKSVIQETRECLKKTIDEAFSKTSRNILADNMETDTQLASNAINGDSTSDVISAFLSEEKERSKRRYNVIVHYVEESTADNSQERKEYDISTISSIFAKHLGVKTTIVNADHIGKKQEAGGSSKPRLVKVTVASEHEKALLLRNCTRLHDKSNPEEVRRIYVTPDLTPKEQQQNKALRSQLAKMNEGGRKYWIKNGRIVQRGT